MQAPQEGVSVAGRVGAPTAPSLGSTLGYLFVSLRPKQWTKNLILYLAPIFTINQFWHIADVPSLVRVALTSSAAFVLFCLLSSGVYLLNDLIDLEADRQHPTKRQRPLPSGRLRPLYAALAAALLLGVSLGGGITLHSTFGLMATGYLGLMVVYSYALKHVVIVDVFTVAAGFVLRAAAGAVVLNVPISPWLYIGTILGALFLGFHKRRHELLLLNERSPQHRPILQEYTPSLLDQMIAVVTPTTVVAYSLYTFTAEGLPQNHAMMLTIPFVLYGVFRYLYLVHQKNAGGSPEEVLLQDRPLFLTVVLWAVTSAVILSLFR